jgi:stearoyl-CoA desaturase (delta-9 desaturase)
MADTAFAAMHRKAPANPIPIAEQDKSETKLGVKPLNPTNVPSDIDVPDNYVTRTIETQKRLPPVTWGNLLKNIQWVSFLALTVTPALAIYGVFNVNWNTKTAIWSVIYYFITGLGITAGYHRLWAHRSYTASRPLEYILACAGAGAVQGSIKWWSRGHRAHHRYTDTNLDPYSAHEGFWWAHVGWMIFKPRTKIGVADISDLTRSKVVRWQHNNYLSLLLVMGLFFPMGVAGLGWGDWKGGFFFAGAARLLFVHHSTFCVNSLAHWLGEHTFDDKHTPRDHFITALVTIGEGYHNFHHQFPMDYRNAIKWHQYDPTKWFIATMQAVGLASHLKKFPDNEIKKGIYTMQLQKLAQAGEVIEWPTDSNHLPVVSWDDFVDESKNRALIAVHGFIHDVSSFMDDHPGGQHALKRFIGKDATTAFYGGVYDHSHAAQNLLAMMRVGCLEGGMEVEHLKQTVRQRSLSGSSAASSSADLASLSSFEDHASSNGELSDLEYLADLPKKEPFKHQPGCYVADKYTLAIPPSEKYAIVKKQPRLRRTTAGSMTSMTSLEDVSRADKIGDVSPMVAA